MQKYSHTVLSRVSDLDTQRHINNSNYGTFALEAQYAALQQKGLSVDFLLAHEIHFCITASTTHFHRQQTAFTELKIETEYMFNAQGQGVWRHNIYADAIPAATLITNTVFLKNKQPFLPPQILPFCNAEVPPAEMKLNLSLSAVPPNCRMAEVEVPMRYVDLNVFQKYPPTLFWRFCEEGRWNFLDEMGLTFDVMFEKDIMFFLLRNEYRYYQHERQKKMKVYTWFDELSRARSYIRQNVMSENNEPILETRGEFVLVSLSKSRPIRIPPFILEVGKKYMVHGDNNE